LTSSKNIKIRSNFHTGHQVFIRCDESVKVKEKVKMGFSLGLLGLYLSENVTCLCPLRTNHLVLSIISLHGVQSS